MIVDDDDDDDDVSGCFVNGVGLGMDDESKTECEFLAERKQSAKWGIDTIIKIAPETKRRKPFEGCVVP